MYEELKKLKDEDKPAYFLFPSYVKAVKGKVSDLTPEVVFVDATLGGQDFQFVTHPNSICIVGKRT